MYKRRSFVLLVFAIAFSAAFAASFLFPFKAARSSVESASLFGNAFASRFEQVKLSGTGEYRLSSIAADNQYFNLKSRFLNSGGGETPGLVAQPVFSANEMEDIVDYGLEKVYKQQKNDAGFIILDDANTVNSVQYNNYVVFELENVTSIQSWTGKRNGADIARQTSSQAATLPDLLNSAVNNVDTIHYNNNNLCAAFWSPGYYEFDFSVIAKGFSAEKLVNLKFGFFIASIADYSEYHMPVFDEPLQAGLVKNGKNFYYNYQDSAPEVNFTPNRFDVSIDFKDYNSVSSDSGIVYSYNSQSGRGKYIFKDVGTYTVLVQMTFPYGGGVVKIPTTRYLTHSYNLDIFGYQAYFEDYRLDEAGGVQSWFGTTNGTNSDITDKVNIPAPVTNDTAISTLVGSNEFKTLTPVVTNMPPVYLRGISKLSYADEANRTGFYSRVAYRQSKNSSWQYSEYDISKPFFKAGEYAVILYYGYNAAENDSSKIYKQAFYFKINDFCAEVSLSVGGVAYSFSEFIGKELFGSGAIYLYDGQANVGPYEREPLFDLFFVSAVGGSNKYFRNFNPTTDDIAGLGDGTYTFRVYFGNNSGRVHMPHMDFNVILDRAGLSGFVCKSTGVEMDVTAENMSVFGAGDVTLSWAVKSSGIGMSMAELDYYEIKKSGGGTLSDTINSQSIEGSHSLRAVERRNLRIDTILYGGDVIGYKLSDKLSAPGLYVIAVTDVAGNKTLYTIIIDDSSPGFAQRQKVDSTKEINIKSEATTVGFGNYKIIPFYPGTTLGANVPQVSGLITSSGILIPIVSKLKSTDGINFNVSLNTIAETLNGAGNYFYKVTDALGNTASHYLQINFDLTHPMVLEDNTPTIYDGNVLSSSATMITNGAISNRDYLTFSFIQAADNKPTTQYYVETVKIAYYELTFKTLKADGSTNTNYPFSDTVSYIETIDITAKFANKFNQRLYIDVNRMPTTRQGLYVVSRICSSATPSLARVANYYFIVDKNPIISDQNFESGIQVNFGSGADMKTAGYKDFQKGVQKYIGDDGRLLAGNHKILQGNSAAVVKSPAAKSYLDTTRVPGLVLGSVSVPGSSINKYDVDTKYGNAVFSLVAGDFTGAGDNSNKYVAFTSLKLVQTISRQNSETGVFEKIATGMTTSGLYAVEFKDGSGGWPWRLDSIDAESDGNSSQLLIELFINQPQGAFLLNGNQVSSSAWQPSQPSNPTVTNPIQVMSSVKAGNSDVLRFSFSNDSSNFLQTIETSGIYGPQVTLDNYALTRDVVPLTLTRKGSLTVYQFNLPMENVTSGSTFSILLNTEGGTMPIRYTLTIDTTRPNSNLDRIMNTSSDGDRWFVNKSNYFEHRQNVLTNAGGNLDDNTINPLKYPFRISNSFVFRTANTSLSTAKGNPYFDTQRISYYEVTAKLANITGEYRFDYAGVNAHPSDKTFYEIVGMKSTENRFFRIVEHDEAGNRAEYFVELRGANYIDSISISGVSEYQGGKPTGQILAGNLINKVQSGYDAVRGIGLTVQDVSDFYNNNLFFEISCGNNKIQRFGLNSLTLEEFKTQLQRLIDGALNWSAIMTIDNRFEVYSFEIRNIDRSIGQLVIGNARVVGTGVEVTVSTGGMSAFSDGYFYYEIYNYTDKTTQSFPRRSLSGNMIIALEDSKNDYLITVYDEFGRAVKFAYNGKYGSDISLMDGGMYRDGKLYYGSSGTTVTYIASAYEFSLYRDGELVYRDGVSVAGVDLSGIVVTEWASIEADKKVVRIFPEVYSKANWRVVALRRGTSERWEREFNFYTLLPEIRFSNLNGDDWTTKLTVNGEIANGIVVVEYSAVGLLFDASASYTRTYEGKTTYTPIGTYMPKFNLLYSGDYVVEIINELGARATYKFTINDASNRNYRVYFNNAEVFAAPQQYSISGNNIPNFFVKASSANEVLNFLKVETTNNTKYTVVTPTATSETNSTLVYRLVSETTGTQLSFAVTYISNNLETLSIGVTSFTGVTGVNWDNISTDARYSVYYQNVINRLATGYLTVSLNNGYNGFVGNYVYAEYYRNGGRGEDGEYCGTLVGKQELTIYAKDYGYYTFYVYDHAGNKRKFGGSAVSDYFTLVNLGRGPLMVGSIVNEAIKYDAIIDDMVYNDSVALSVIDIPYDPIPGTGYPYAKSLSVYKNNSYRSDLSYYAANKAQSVTSFIFNEVGFYRIEFVYQISQSVAVLSRHSFVIASSVTGQQNFSFNAGSNMEIIGVIFEKSDIRKNYTEAVLKNVVFGANTGFGTYKVTVQIGADNIYSHVRTREFTVITKNVPDVGITCSINFGTSTTSKVKISMDSGFIYSNYGETELLIYRDGKSVKRIIIGKNGETDYGNYAAATLSAVGKYQVYLVSAGATISDGIVRDGDVYFTEGFVIEEEMNILTIVFIVIVLGVVAFGLFLFIKMRIGLRVK